MARGLCIRNWHNCENWNINVTRRYMAVHRAALSCFVHTGARVLFDITQWVLVLMRVTPSSFVRSPILHFALNKCAWPMNRYIQIVLNHVPQQLEHTHTNSTYSRRDANYFPLFFSSNFHRFSCVNGTTILRCMSAHSNIWRISSANTIIDKTWATPNRLSSRNWWISPKICCAKSRRRSITPNIWRCHVFTRVRRWTKHSPSAVAIAIWMQWTISISNSRKCDSTSICIIWIESWSGLRSTFHAKIARVSDDTCVAANAMWPR